MKNKRTNKNSNYALTIWKNQLSLYLRVKLNMSTICSSRSLNNISLMILNKMKNKELMDKKVMFQRFVVFSKDKKLKNKTHKTKVTIHSWLKKYFRSTITKTFHYKQLLFHSMKIWASKIWLKLDNLFKIEDLLTS